MTTDSAGPGLRERIAASASQETDYVVRRARRLMGVSVAPGLLLSLLGSIRDYDVIHLTGTYSFPTLPTLLLARLTGTPVVWSPRGAIQATAEWEEAPRRRLKRAFQWLADVVRPADTVLHVTSEEERHASMRSLPDIKVRVIPNSVAISEGCQGRSWRPNGELRLMFLSRIHPKKGLESLIAAMQRLPDWVRLDIYGNGDPSYVAAIMARADADRRITFHGEADDAAKQNGFAQADLFVLPSWSENFGIVVAEALASGVPVLTTNKTPWRDLERQGCGRCFDPDQDDLVAEIRAMSEKDLENMGQRGRVWMRTEFSQEAMCDAFIDLYLELAGKGTAEAA